MAQWSPSAALTSDPIAKKGGWSSGPSGRVTLKRSWQAPPPVGVGQDVVRDSWEKDPDFAGTSSPSQPVEAPPAPTPAPEPSYSPETTPPPPTVVGRAQAPSSSGAELKPPPPTTPSPPRGLPPPPPPQGGGPGGGGGALRPSPLTDTSGLGIKSQFGDPQLSLAEAQAACGPAAAISFARRFGRNPTLREATDIAKLHGNWDPGNGMHGAASEVQLLSDIGVEAKLGPASEGSIHQAVSAGSPVIISTPKHYFVADQVNDQGVYHVGASGTVFRAGGEWMTLGQMHAVGGGLNGAIYPDMNSNRPDPTFNPDTGPIGRMQLGGSSEFDRSRRLLGIPVAGEASGSEDHDSVGTSGGGGDSATKDEIRTYIRKAATQRGIDPDTAERVALSEGGFAPATPGDKGSSFGPFQLHYGGGLGDVFTRQTGMRADNPATWKQQVDFALDQAAKGGWGPWHGAKRSGISQWQGIGTGVGQDEPDPGGGYQIPTAADVRNVERQGVNLNAQQTPGGGYQVPTAADVRNVEDRGGDLNAGLTPGGGYQVPTSADVINLQKRNDEYRQGRQAAVQDYLNTQQKDYEAEPGNTPQPRVMPDEGTPLPPPGPNIEAPRQYGMLAAAGVSPEEFEKSRAQVFAGGQPTESVQAAATEVNKQADVQANAMAQGIGRNLDFSFAPQRNQAVLAAARGETVNPLEVGQEAAAGLAHSVVPDEWKNVGVGPLTIENGVAAGLDPSNMVQVAAFNVAGKGAKVLAELAGEKILPKFTGKTAEIASALWRATPAPAREAAQAHPGFALGTAAAAAGGAIGYKTAPEGASEAERWQRALAVGVAGAGIGLTAPEVGQGVMNKFWEYMAPTKLIREPEIREAVVALAQERNGAAAAYHLEKLGMERVLGKPGTGVNTLSEAINLEKLLDLGPAATPEQRAAAQAIVAATKQMTAEGLQAGFIKSSVVNRLGTAMYFPHVYEDTPMGRPRWASAAFKKFGEARDLGLRHGASPHDFYSFERDEARPLLEDAVKQGFKPLGSISEPISMAVAHHKDSMAKARFLKNLRDFVKKNPSAEPAMVPWKNIGLPDGYERVLEGHDPALAPWAFRKDVARVLNNVYGKSKLRDNAATNALLRTNAAFKYVMLGSSGFHAMNELRQVMDAAGYEKPEAWGTMFRAVYQGFNKPAYEKFVAANAHGFQEAANDGLTMLFGDAGADIVSKEGMLARGAAGGVLGGAAGFTEGKKAGDTEDKTKFKAAMGATLGAVMGAGAGPFSDALWGRMIPTMKYSTYDILKKSGIAGADAAEFTNEVFGGQLVAAAGRSKTVQDALRLTFFAPDWQEGWVRQMANGVLSLSPGATSVQKLNRKYWTEQVLAGAFGLESLNMAFNGHFSDQNGPGRWYYLEMTGLYDKMGWEHKNPANGQDYRVYMDVLGPYRGFLQAPSDPGSFFFNRLGIWPGFVRDAGQENDPYTHKPLVPEGEDWQEKLKTQLGRGFERIAPIGAGQVIQGMDKDPAAVTAFSLGTGFRVSHESELSQMLKQQENLEKQYNLSLTRIQQDRQGRIDGLNAIDRKTADLYKNTSVSHQQLMADLHDQSQRKKELAQPQWNEVEFPVRLFRGGLEEQQRFLSLLRQTQVGIKGTAGPADIDFNQYTHDLGSLADSYWSPPGTEKLDPVRDEDAIFKARGQVLGKASIEMNVDAESLLDAIKWRAWHQGETMPTLTGKSGQVTSQELNGWVSSWGDVAESADPSIQADGRRKVIEDAAKQTGLPAAQVWKRMQLRMEHPVKKDPVELSRDTALDLLFASHEPNKFPRYAGTDGKPMGTEEDWKTWDKAIGDPVEALSPKKQKSPEVQQALDARLRATRVRKLALLDSPGWMEYQRWFGIGRSMSENEWTKFREDPGAMFKDHPSGGEANRRLKIIEKYKALSREQRGMPKNDEEVPVGGKLRKVSITQAYNALVKDGNSPLRLSNEGWLKRVSEPSFEGPVEGT